MNCFYAIHRRKFSVALSLILFCAGSVRAAERDSARIVDSHHYSQVFGETRHYRVFLPSGYKESRDKQYPVIYFFHGWSQRYFGSSNPYGDFDKGDENGGDNIANFVSEHDVIVVKADGYNRSPGEPYYVRPYNVSPVETYRQFPIYFPELVEHIDGQYRTIADREHRGVSGLSMGGFMTFWIAGKYPHLVSAAGNFCGSPEFEVGPKDFPVEYRHLDMYKNYGGINVRLHYGDKDFIRGYHRDLNRVWTQVVDNYTYKIFDAAHSTAGMGEMFSFILKTFENPPSKPARWHHTDVYPQFDVWGYRIGTDRTEPGFTVLENVDERGFRCSVREYLPDGRLMPSVKVAVRTPSIYKKNQQYIIQDFNRTTKKGVQHTVLSDTEGALTINLDGGAHEIGISERSGRPNITATFVGIHNRPWATHDEDVTVEVKLLNKGQEPAKNVRATFTPTRPGISVEKNSVTISQIPINGIADALFTFRVADDSAEMVQFKLAMRDDRKNEWVEYFEIPLKRKAQRIQQIEIADGRIVTVAKSGVDTETILLGHGNGDGIANPGESIVILVKDQDKLWRTDAKTNDAHVNPFGLNVRRSDNWSSFDHVGGSVKYRVPLIASTCPEGHQAQFFVQYWLPEYPLHHIREGIATVVVTGKDATAPLIGRIHAAGDNVLEVQITDGSATKNVKARLISADDPKKSLETSLTDDGRNGDRAENDLLFSQNIPSQVYGIFRVVVEAEDSFGNKSVFEPEERFVFH